MDHSDGPDCQRELDQVTFLERGRGLLGRSEDFKNLAEAARVGMDVYASTLGG